MDRFEDYDNIILGIAMPHTDRYYLADFVHSFFCLRRPMPAKYIMPISKGPIDHLRNECVKSAMVQEVTHIWFCDTDQVYPNDTLLKLLSHKLPIVAAKVHRRYPPYDPILMRGNIDEWKDIPPEEWESGQLVEVDATGCGSVLYDMKVFKKIPYPWFEYKLDDPAMRIGEDIGFCVKLKEYGYKIFVDCSIRIGHLKTSPITEETYWSYKYMQPVTEESPTKVIQATKPKYQAKGHWEDDDEPER